LDANREVELKLSPLGGTLRDIGRAVVRAGAKRSGRSRKIRSIYFDNGDHSLRDNGYNLRIRLSKPDNIQTVKATKPDAAVLGRGEWEAKIRGDRPVAGAAADSPLSKLLSRPKDWEQLQPIFTVEVDRAIYLIERGEAMIEVALDEGAVRHEGSEQSIIEAELELKKGEPQALLTFAHEIVAAVPCLVCLTSKGERGYRLAAGEASRPATSLKLSLDRDVSIAQATSAMGHACLAALFDNLAMLIAGGGLEALHQTRVSLRRLRAILSLFKPVCGEEAGRRFIRDELKWLSGILREGRELDVLITSVLEPSAAANQDVPGFGPLVAAFRSRRDRAYAAIIDNLRSHRLSELNLDLVGHLVGSLAAGVPCSDERRQKPAARFVTKELRRRVKSFLRDSRAIEQLAPAEQHRIRLRAKKLRYMIEPVGDLLSSKHSREVVSALHGIQNALGDLNDCKVNRKLILTYAQEALGGDASKQSPLLAAGLAAAACMGPEAMAISKATAARKRLARAGALCFG
jgi:triphosphatase